MDLSENTKKVKKGLADQLKKEADKPAAGSRISELVAIFRKLWAKKVRS